MTPKTPRLQNCFSLKYSLYTLSHMELGVEYVRVSRYGIRGVLKKVGKKVKVLSIIPQDDGMPVILLYDLENRKIVGVGIDDDSITLGIFTLLAMSNGVANVSGGKIVSVEIADEFLENPAQFSRYSENVM